VLDMVNRSAASPTRTNSRKAMKWILIDSAIIGGIALWAVSPAGWPTWADLWVMARAFGAAFVAQLAIERGIKKG